jgi:hypothetical protein
MASPDVPAWLDHAISVSQKSGCLAAACDLAGELAVALCGKPREVNPRVNL